MYIGKLIKVSYNSFELPQLSNFLQAVKVVTWYFEIKKKNKEFDRDKSTFLHFCLQGSKDKCPPMTFPLKFLL